VTPARVHDRWPLIPLSSHRSADSSSDASLLQAKGWLRHCLDSHVDCSASTDSLAKLPTRVIVVGHDSENPYLYETEDGERGNYAALSYCWGQTRTFTTTQSTLQARKDGFVLSGLPKTCRDAIVVARAVGIPYVWIDSLCIVQDSKDDWMKEAALMGDIYSNAVVTIAALDSPDSDTGLFVSYPTRQTFYLTCALDHGQLGYVYARKGLRGLKMGFLHADRSPPGEDFGGVLQTRGWTLQELTLSPRVLWFSAWELGWSCRAETACECNPIPTTQLMKRGASRLTTLPQKGEPPIGLGMWRDFVKVFTARKLTFQTDRLPALTGIATAMSKRISGRYFAGLWEDQLEKNLLWTTTRLEFIDVGEQQVAFLEADSPTWSWACIPGPIWFVNFTESLNYQTVWRIQNVDFQCSTSNKFGPGQGKISVESFVLPLTISDDGYFVCPVAEDYVYFSDTVNSWYPDRMDLHEQGGLAEADLSFVFAGIQWRLRETPQEHATSFVGLVVARTTEDVYHRAGLVEAAFSTYSCDGSWADWRSRSNRRCLTLA
jgi:hypothetical protein